MNDMDRRIADDPTLTDAQKLQHAFGNKFIPLNVAIEDACGQLRLQTTARWAYETLEKTCHTYLAEMREFIERMGEAETVHLLGDVHIGEVSQSLKIQTSEEPGDCKYCGKQQALESAVSGNMENDTWVCLNCTDGVE